MTKVKLIANQDAATFEREINDFISQDGIYVIDIQYQSMAITNEYDHKGIPISGVVIDRALITYRVADNDRA